MLLITPTAILSAIPLMKLNLAAQSLPANEKAEFAFKVWTQTSPQLPPLRPYFFFFFGHKAGVFSEIMDVRNNRGRSKMDEWSVCTSIMSTFMSFLP